nr:RNA-directed DNA polymerase, eukaryota [Tanacetum cinerariifolium]
QRITLDAQFPNQLSFEQHQDLEISVTYNEIKCAVWDCGSNKSPRPDGFTFDFYRRYWKLIDQNVVNAVSEFFSSGCLNSAMRSIIVNGSPTPEFKFHKGLKQGDPLSPFLFILLKETLHLSFKNILNAGLYKGIQVDESLTLSHLFYADDAVFIGKWDKTNINVIISVLNCFFLASGLKINLHKRNLMGIDIPRKDVFMAANSIRCTTLMVPFNYLGVKVRRFITNDSSLWYRCIKAIYGDRGALDSPETNKHASVAAKFRDTSMFASFRRVLRGGLEEEQFQLLVDKAAPVILFNIKDRWVWTLDSGGEFSVKSARSYIDDY